MPRAKRKVETNALRAKFDVREGLKSAPIDRILDGYAYIPTRNDGAIAKPIICVISGDDNGYKYYHYLSSQVPPTKSGYEPSHLKQRKHIIRVREQLVNYGLLLNKATWSSLISYSQRDRLSAFMKTRITGRVWYVEKEMFKKGKHNVVRWVRADTHVTPQKIKLCRTKHFEAFELT